MKKLIPLLLVLSLCLAGCGHESAAPSYAFQDLSIQIPEDYIDLSQEEVATGLDFLFGKDPIAVNGLEKKRPPLKPTVFSWICRPTAISC